MTTPRIIHSQAGTLSPAELEEVTAHLRGGGLLAYPTDTVYGFGGLARDDAIRSLAALKPRESPKPFVLLLPDAEQAWGLTWHASARRFAELFWPGPLTLVLSDAEGAFPSGVRSAEGAVAVRVSSGPFVKGCWHLLERRSHRRAPIHRVVAPLSRARRRWRRLARWVRARSCG